VEVLLQTGLSLSELVALTVDDLAVPERQHHGLRRRTRHDLPANETNGSLRVRAHGRRQQRTFPLDEAACQALIEYLKVRPSSAFPNLFLSKGSTPLTVSGASELIKRYAHRAGIEPAGPRALRATYIAHLLAQGVPIAAVQHLAGHKKVATTQQYMGLHNMGLHTTSRTSNNAPPSYLISDHPPGLDETAPGQHYGVLVVTHEVSAREALRAGLETDGHAVCEASDGVIALDMIRFSRLPLVVLIENMLPRMAGVDVLREVVKDKQLCTHHAFIWVANPGRLPKQLADLLATHAIPVVVKPFDIDALHFMIAAVGARFVVRTPTLVTATDKGQGSTSMT
jgi:CheY-like chemotaxis protein